MRRMAADAGRPEGARLGLRMVAAGRAGHLRVSRLDRVQREQTFERRFDVAALTDGFLERRPLGPEDRLHPPPDALAGGAIV